MKIYLAMCSLCLAAGATLGHFNGKYAAATGFVDNCENLRFVVFNDKETNQKRHFHCFELPLPDTSEAVLEPARAHVPVI